MKTLGRTPIQFGILHLFLLLLSAAVGLALLRPDGANWIDAALSALMFWLLLGLLQQAYDFGRACRGHGDLTREQRWGARFAIGWRLCLVLTLAAIWLIECLRVRHLVTLPEMEHDYVNARVAATEAWPALVGVSLVIMLGSVPRLPPRRPASWWSRLLDGLAWIAAGVVSFMLTAYYMQILVLMYLEVVSMEQVAPLHLAIELLDVNAIARAEAFYIWSVLAALLLAVDLCLIVQLARRWDRGLRARWLWGGLLTGGLFASAWHLDWVATVGVWTLSPYMVAGFGLPPWHIMAAAIVLLIFMATVAAYRIVSHPPPETKSNRHWRRRGAYYHERLALLGLLTIALVVDAGYELSDFMIGWNSAFRWVQVDFALTCPHYYLRLAIVLALIGGLWASWRAPREVAAPMPLLSPGRFLVIWLAMLLTLVCGIPALAAAGFAVWLSPWFLPF